MRRQPPGRRTVPHTVVLALVVGLWPCAEAAGQTPTPQAESTRETAPLQHLLEALSFRARLPGSTAESEAAGECRAALERLDFAVTVAETPVTFRVPTRQDLQVFAGANEELAVAERYEVFDWDALPTWPMPPVYRDAGAGDVRAAVVDAGAGAAADYERLAAQRIEVRGFVVLVRSDAPPAMLTQEALARGAAALLVHAPRRSDVPTWPEGPWASDRQLAGGDVLRGNTLPVAPIRASEVEAIVSRLRARRVRGADGATVTLQVGPGPVEVRLALTVPAREVRAQVLTARSPGAAADAPRITAPLASFGFDALAAAETATAILAAELAAGHARGARGVELVLGPTELESALAAPAATLRGREVPAGRELGALLAYGTDLAHTGADGYSLLARHLDPGATRARAVAAFVAEALGGPGSSEAEAAAFVDLARARLPWLTAPKAQE